MSKTTHPNFPNDLITTEDFNASGEKKGTKDFIWYLVNVCGGVEKFEFPTHEEAYAYGWKLRETHGEKIKVDISATTVRVKVAS